MRFGTRQVGNATCEISACRALPDKMKKDIREVSSVYCPPEFRGRGDATALMESVCKEADSKRMILVLIVGPYGDDAPMDKAKLLEWYTTSFDFNTIQAEPLILARMFDPFPKPVLADKISQIITEGVK